MSLEQTNSFFKNKESKTSKKWEKQTYQCVLDTFSALASKDLTDDQKKEIDQKIESINFGEDDTFRKRETKKKHTAFLNFLKDKYGYTKPNHFTEKGMIFGMIIGMSIGTSLGIALDNQMGSSIGTSTGMCIGMGIGVLFGRTKDKKASDAGQTLVA